MIALPTRLNERLSRVPELHGLVLTTAANCAQIYEERPAFFPEYTDHAASHIESVLRTADALISDRAYTVKAGATDVELLTPQDAAALALSVFLHDIGMHLTFDGFMTLIKEEGGGDSNVLLIKSMDSRSWSEMWAEYLAESRRWDARKRISIFGEDADVRTPPTEPGLITLLDRLLIGNFLRQQHPRVAHETAIAGFPGRNGRVAVLPKGAFFDFPDLVGLIARSHGMPLRDAVENLRRFHTREYQKIHAGFLMVILRIADYLQVDADRAPGQKLQLTGLRSPTSKLEWNAHAAIRNVSFEEEDPEAIHVEARPPDIHTFLRIKRLLADLQAELDISWAVLGELYGRYPDLRDLTIDLRRVKSNIDDVSKFAATADYVPVRARFEAVTPDLLKLLIQPLYGEDAHAGVRELIQNAIDACREREDILKRFPKRRSRRFDHDNVDVELSLDKHGENGWELTIADCGVGMTAETVISYFLRAGATYRSADEWKDKHTVGGRGQRSRVLRSGRFGIGVLAAFLLGDELSVKTRHILAPESQGVTFTARLDTEEIELKRIDCAPGTVLHVKLRPKAVEQIIGARAGHSDFRKLPVGPYLLQNPMLRILVNGEEVHRDEFWPSQGATLPNGWHRLRAKGFADVQWSYRTSHARDSRIALNGIALTDTQLKAQDLGGRAYLYLPDISVFDPDGRLGVTLDRNGLIDGLPFEDELFEEVGRDVISHLLLLPSDTPRYFDHPGLNHGLRFAYSQHSYALVNPAFLQDGHRWRALVVSGPFDADWREIVAMLPRSANTCLISDFYLRRKGEEYLVLSRETQLWAEGLRVTRGRVFVRDAVRKQWPTTRNSRKWQSLSPEWKGSAWVSLVERDTDGPLVKPDCLEAALEKGGASLATECWIEREPYSNSEQQSLQSFWTLLVKRYLGDSPWIPYAIDRRRRRFANTFKELKAYMNRAVEASLRDLG